jgi:4-deoxy-L-threo-5-hexosulose-uronate ketol-isomerase
MEVRYSPDPVAARTMSTADIRRHFLVEGLFAPDAVPMVYSDVDRSITGSAVPVREPLKLLATKKEMAAEYFLERREIGIVNIGGRGKVTADGKEFPMETRDGLYLGKGTKEVTFHSADAAGPAKFYFVSFPAHAAHPAARVSQAEAETVRLGSQKDANSRTLRRYIHLNGIRSCQLVMGVTELDEGSVWNTMPVHTHQRRSEIYMYFNVPPEAVVIHLLGPPDETKHVMVRDGQAVISPSWSVHSGVGTRNYTFVWAMGGENQVFDDMDWVEMKGLG